MWAFRFLGSITGHGWFKESLRLPGFPARVPDPSAGGTDGSQCFPRTRSDQVIPLAGVGPPLPHQEASKGLRAGGGWGVGSLTDFSMRLPGTSGPNRLFSPGTE